MTLDAVFTAALVATTLFTTLRGTPPVEAPTIQIAPESAAVSISVRHAEHERTRKQELAARMTGCSCHQTCSCNNTSEPWEP
ncbi:MAG TPA: hypothetical protein VGG28_34080 [Kofleriaceae bacterium]